MGESPTWKTNFKEIDSVIAALKVVKRQQLAVIDFFTAKLHYQLTVALLFFASGVLLCRQLSGEIIQCTVGEDVKDEIGTLADTFCLIHSTYTAPRRDRPAAEAHPGVSPVRLPPNSEEMKQQRYYLWIHLFLFFMGLCFYVPRYFWKSCEGGQVQMLVKDLHLNNPELKDLTRVSISELYKIKPEELKNKLKPILERGEYFVFHMGYNKYYITWFLVAQILYFLNLALQIILLDRFFGNELSTYGLQVFGFMEEDPGKRVDAIEAVFPKVSKCNFGMYGPSGNILKYDFICLLPINILNEKIFVYTWWWFLVMMIVSLGSLAYWIPYVLSPRFRFLEIFNARCYEFPHLRNHLSLGDTFLLHQLKRNVDPNIFIILSHTIQIGIRDKLGLKKSVESFEPQIEISVLDEPTHV